MGDVCIICGRARSNCDLFVLTKSDFESALVQYPHIAEQIRDVASKRADLAVLTDRTVAEAAAEGRSFADTARAVSNVHNYFESYNIVSMLLYR